MLQLSSELTGSTSICVVMFPCGLLQSILWNSTLPMEKSLHTDLVDRHS